MMLIRPKLRVTLLGICLGVLTFSSVPAAADVKLRWRGENYEASELPEGMSAAARSAIASWNEWAKTNHYRMDLSEDGRVLLVTRDGNKARGRQMKLVEETIAYFDKRLPAPANRALLAAAEPPGGDGEEGGPAGDPLTDDPEGESHPWESPGDVGLEELDDPEEVTWAWGAGSIAPDTETIVFFVLRKPAQYEGVLDRMAEIAPYLGPWVGRAKKFTGFTLEQPLAGSFVEIGEGREEWQPEGELVNRLASLLLLRRFGRQPYWITQGFAWHVELAIRGGIYCFPYRDEFVFATEHSGWKGSLRALFAARDDRPLQLGEAAAWSRGTYRDAEAKISWGIVDFFLAKHGAELPAMLETLRVFRDTHDRIQDSETEWHRDSDYLIPVEEQDRIFGERVGKDYLRAATAHFRGETP